jgi:hypothetical protein
MTISSATNRNDYIGNGTADTFAYSFRILDDDHLLVTVRDSTGTETTLTKTTDYTVTGVGTSGGNVLLVNGSQDWLDVDGDLDTGWYLTIRRVLPLTQPTDIRNQGAFYPEVHEDALDRLVMQNQQQQDELDRSVKLSETIDPSTFDGTVPSEVVGQAGGILQVNSTGDGWTVGASTVVGTTVTAYMATVLDDLNAAAARTTLGALSDAAGAVGTTNLAALAVTTAKLDALAVTTAKLDAGAVTRAKITETVNLASKTATYTATASDDVILCNANGGAFTINLPAAASSSGLHLVIKKTDSSFNAVTIDGNASETIDGVTTKKLSTQYESMEIVCDGSNWHIIRRHIPNRRQTFTPTGGWNTNVTYTGSWWREGNHLCVEGHIACTGAPNAADASITIPNSLTIDTALLSATSHPLSFGTCVYFDATGGTGSGLFTGEVLYLSSTTVQLYGNEDNSATNNDLRKMTNTDPVTFINTDKVWFEFKVPISGWES